MVRSGTEYETLRVREDNEVLRVTLDRQNQQNSINGTMLEELHLVLDRAERSPQCRVVVLEGGAGVFSTGMDFADATSSRDSVEDVSGRGGEAFLGLLKRLTAVPRAVVAQVDGRVSGGGVGIVAASDFVFSSTRSTFGLPEALWGLLPCCVLPFLIRRVGFQSSYSMTLSTLPVSAEKAHRMHLVDELVEDADVPLRRLRSRLTKVDADTIADLKRYAARMWFLSEEMERTAVAEFTRLMSSPVVRARISGFATAQVFPWESR